MQPPFIRPQCSCTLPFLNAAALYPPSMQLHFTRPQCSCTLPFLNAAALYPSSMQLHFTLPQCSCTLPFLNAAALYPPSMQLHFTRPQCSCTLRALNAAALYPSSCPIDTVTFCTGKKMLVVLNRHSPLSGGKFGCWEFPECWVPCTSKCYFLGSPSCLSSSLLLYHTPVNDVEGTVDAACSIVKLGHKGLFFLRQLMLRKMKMCSCLHLLNGWRRCYTFCTVIQCQILI